MIPHGFFITGTDTDAGKTLISASLLHLFKIRGLKTIGFKPVASGGHQDTLMAQQNASEFLPTEIITPFFFAEAIAPHIAAQKNNDHLSVAGLLQRFHNIQQYHADLIIIEGAGGWLTPLNENETLADFAAAISYPVILVVGMRLGCVNHALLTVAAIQARGLSIHGWVANCIDEKMQYCAENISSLQRMIAAPLLGIVPYQKEISVVNTANYLNAINP
jgi:dethiobiotin synthetase